MTWAFFGVVLWVALSLPLALFLAAGMRRRRGDTTRTITLPPSAPFRVGQSDLRGLSPRR